MLLHTLRAALLLLASASALAAPPSALPPELQAALARAKIPQDALALLVLDAEGKTAPRLSHRAQVAMNPASVMKLTTTFAALDLLGPAYAWTTPVYVDGPLRDGSLSGNVYIKGQGDPKLVLERLWLMLRRLQGLGLQQIAGDIVIDRDAFALAPSDPAQFDGEPLRPYNAAPDAFLVNFSSVVFTFTPDVEAGVARIQAEPPLAGVRMPEQVPLSSGACNDYRSALAADFADPLRPRFKGRFPVACGERVWPVAYADPAQFAARAVHGMWRSLGGKLSGSVRYGSTPQQVLAHGPAFSLKSPPLAEVVRDINKFSNNVMAQQLYLTLGRASAPGPGQAQGAASFAASHALLQAWWTQRVSPTDAPLLENGSGLSRQESISANALGQLLQVAYASPSMPELMASLPIAGQDGTLRRSTSTAMAHMKTGSLNNVLAIGGYVLARSGRRYVVVAMVNHPNASAARPALDALLEWASND